MQCCCDVVHLLFWPWACNQWPAVRSSGCHCISLMWVQGYIVKWGGSQVWDKALLAEVLMLQVTIKIQQECTVVWVWVYLWFCLNRINAVKYWLWPREMVKSHSIKIVNIRISWCKNNVIKKIWWWRDNLVDVQINLADKSVSIRDMHVSIECNDAITVDVSATANIEQPICEIVLIMCWLCLSCVDCACHALIVINIGFFEVLKYGCVSITSGKHHQSWKKWNQGEKKAKKRQLSCLRLMTFCWWSKSVEVRRLWWLLIKTLAQLAESVGNHPWIQWLFHQMKPIHCHKCYKEFDQVLYMWSSFALELYPI